MDLRARDVGWVALCREVASRDPLRSFAASRGDRFYWERPDARIALATQGCVAVIEGAGASRFEHCEREAAELWARLRCFGEAPGAPGGPILVGGFAFDDAPHPDPLWTGFPAARFVLPQRCLARIDDCCFETRLTRLRPGESPEQARDRLEARAAEVPTAAPAPEEAPQPPRFTAIADRTHADYQALVEQALACIGSGDLEKVVLARRVSVEGSSHFDAPALLDGLRTAYQSCASFGVGVGDAVYLGATPERMLRVSGDRFETAALAGSAPRGRSPAEDARFARALVESKKEQSEHAVVVREMRAALEPHCRELELAESPRLLQLEGIQHLETPMRGRLKPQAGLLMLARALHPTPAVAGAPRKAAIDWLARREALARGWYGGPVGWIERDGGDLAVALRSALLRGSSASCFAGAGIVAGSRPEQELAETRLKLNVLLGRLLEL